MSPNASVQDFEQWVHRHHAAVYRSAFRVLQNEADALDVTQEVFMRAFRGRALKGAEVREPARALCWLAVRTALAHLRGSRNRRSREDRYAVEQDSEVGAPTPETREERAALWRSVEELSEDLALAVRLRFQEGLTFAAMGRALGCSEPSAHDRVRRALETLRRRLSAAGLVALVPGLEAHLEREPLARVPVGLERSLLELPRAAAGALAGGVVSAPLLALLGVLVSGVVLVIGFAGDPAPRAADAGGGARPDLVGTIIAPADQEPPAPPAPRAPGVARGLREALPLGADGDDPPGSSGPASGLLIGRVFDEQGHGVSAARVTASSAVRDGKLSRYRAVGVTDMQGDFALAVPVEGDGERYGVQVEHPDLALARVDGVLVPPGGESVPQLLEALRGHADTPGEWRLGLTVVGPTGLPLAGVSARIERRVLGAGGEPSWRRVGQAHSGAGGRVELAGTHLGEKRLVLDGQRATPPGGRAVHLVRFDWPGVFEERFELDEGADIAGRLATVDGRVPLEVEVYARTAEFPNEWVRAAQDGDGSFRFEGLQGVPHEVWTWGRGWSSARFPTVEPGRRDLWIHLKARADELDRGDHQGELHGLIVDDLTGAPVAVDGEAVEVDWLPQGDGDEELRRDALPNRVFPRPAQGMFDGSPPPPSPRFHRTDLSPGTYCLAVRTRSYAPALVGPFRLEPGQLVGGIEVRLRRPAAFSGRVLGPDGGPVEGARVAVTGTGSDSDQHLASLDKELRDTAGRQRWSVFHVVQSDSQGRFHFDGLPSDLALRAVVAHPKFEPGTGGLLALRPGEETRGVELRLGSAR